MKGNNATALPTLVNTGGAIQPLGNGTLKISCFDIAGNPLGLQAITDGTLSISSGGTMTTDGGPRPFTLTNVAFTNNGTITFESQSTVSNSQPGNSPGVLVFSSSLTLNGTTTMEINGSTTRGTDYDGINVGTALTYGGNLTLAIGTTFGVGTYTFDLFQISGSQSGSFATGGVTLTDNYTGTLANNGSGVWGLTSGNNTWTFTESTGDLGLTVVPEPATWALVAFSLTAVMVLRRRARNVTCP